MTPAAAVAAAVSPRVPAAPIGVDVRTRGCVRATALYLLERLLERLDNAPDSA